MWVIRTGIILLTTVSHLILKTSASASPRQEEQVSSAARACKILNDSLPTLVAFPGESGYVRSILLSMALLMITCLFFRCGEGSGQYVADIDHFYLSSEQNSTCTVEPVRVEDISTIVSLICSFHTIQF